MANTDIIQRIILMFDQMGEAGLKKIETSARNILTHEKKSLLTAKERYKLQQRDTRLMSEKKRHLESINRQNILRKKRLDLIANKNKEIAGYIDKTIKATTTLGQKFKNAFSNAFSLTKILNRMAFVITAKLSYEVFDRIQKAMRDMVVNSVLFQKEMSKVFTLLAENEDAFKNILSDEVLRAIVNYGQELEKTSRAVYDILSARFEPSEVGVILDASLKLAIGEFTNLKIATSAVTTVLNSFSLSAEHAGEAASFVAQMVTDGKTTLEELEKNLGRVTSQAAQLGFDMRQVGAAFSTITLQGVPTNVALTSLRQLMAKLIKPSGEAVDLINRYGLELDIASIKAGGFTKVLEEMVGLTEKEMLAFASSIRGAQALFALINSGARFQESYNNQLENTGAHLKKYEERMNDVAIAKEKLNGLIKAISIRIGSDFIPAMKIITEVTANLIKGLYAMAIAIKDNWKWLLVFGTAVIVLSIKLNYLTVSLAAVVGALAGPWGVALAVATVIGVLIAAGEQVTEFNESMGDMGGMASQTYGEIREYTKYLKEMTKAELVAYQIQTVRKLSKMKEEGDIWDKSAIKLMEDRLALINKIFDANYSDTALRKDAIRIAIDDYNIAVIRFKKSEQELEHLKEKETALQNLIDIQKENIKNADKEKEQALIKVAIDESEIELAKLQKKIKQESAKLDKEALELVKSQYAATQAGIIGYFTYFNDLISAHEKYLATLTDENDIIKEQIVINKLKADRENEYLQLIVDATKTKIDNIELERKKELEKENDKFKRILINAKYDALISAEKEKIAEKLIKEEIKYQGVKRTALKEWIEKEIKLTDETTARYKVLQKMLALIEKGVDLKIIDWKKLDWGALLGVKTFKSATEAMQDAFNKFGEQVMAGIGLMLQTKLDAIEEDKEADLIALSDKYDAQRDHINAIAVTEAHKAKMLEALAKKEAKEKEELDAKFAKKMSEQKKKNAIAEARIDYAKGLIGIAATYLKIGDFGISAAIVAGMLTAVYGIQMGIIKATEYGKGGLVKVGNFVKKGLGGVLIGPSHAQGGIPIIAEGKEHIMPVKQTAWFLPILEFMRKAKSPDALAPIMNFLGNMTPMTAPVPKKVFVGGGQVVVNNDGYISELEEQNDLLRKQNDWLESIAGDAKKSAMYNRKISKQPKRF